MSRAMPPGATLAIRIPIFLSAGIPNQRSIALPTPLSRALLGIVVAQMGLDVLAATLD
ncbi:MAG: hypothetical protein ACJ74Z_20455 [Bryobacteraceae bacterium]